MKRAASRAFALASGLSVAALALPPTGTALAASGSTVRLIHRGAAWAMNQSSNWSGYNIGNQYPGISTGTLFKSVSGEWVVPKASAHKAGQAEYSASWVGIGGGCVTSNCSVTDNTLIQAGTEQDVSKAGTASYDAWWEIIPQPETKVSLPVTAGDKVQVTVAETSTPGDWSISIKNLTTGKSFSTTTPYSSSMDTAEWIEETPLLISSGGTTLAHMPNLSRVGFRSGDLNGANPHYQTVDQMQLDNNGNILATPSAPNAARNGFNDCTYAASCPTP